MDLHTSAGVVPLAAGGLCNDLVTTVIILQEKICIVLGL